MKAILRDTSTPRTQTVMSLDLPPRAVGTGEARCVTDAEHP